MAIVPAILASILIFMDQQITAVIVNRKEHKLSVRQTLRKILTQTGKTDRAFFSESRRRAAATIWTF